jgi:insulysin
MTGPDALQMALPTRSAARHAELVTDQIEKPSIDTRSYRIIRLENDLEVLLVHDAEADKASAAMDVNVGNYSDERDMPGMAHAVEHLLFLGTKTFPSENDYNQYLSAHSGNSNAYTGATSTNYFFELSGKAANDEPVSAENPSPLRGALDRFSKFFIEPLFQAASLDRELRAVDSEHKKNLQDDFWRMFQLDKSLSNPNHPWSKFATGNLEVLKLLPESRGVNVRDKFIEFHAKHYSANRMKLVILGREPLDLLQTWAVHYFSDVPNKNLKQNRWEDDVPYRPEHLARQCFVKPVMDKRELSLRFPIPEQTDLYESQPSSYVSHLIGHEGPGSIMAYTKSKGWVAGVSAGPSNTCPGSPATFECVIYLTEAGLERWKDIVKIFFRYVSIVRDAKPQEWIFREQRIMDDVNFRFKEKSTASRFTSGASAVMQLPVPRERLLRDRWARKFDPELISNVLDKITPDNMRIALVSQTYPGNWDQKEQYYGTEHRVEAIPDDFMEELRQAAAAVPPTEPVQELHLPHQNNFIPTKLEVDKKEVGKPAVAPRLVRNDRHARTWWKKDDTFWVPRANIFVRFVNPMLRSSPSNAVKAGLFVELITDALEEYAYDATLAGLDYSVSPTDDLILIVSGYNDKLPVLLERVLATMRDLDIKQDRFDIVKDRVRRAYNNWQMQSSFLQLEVSTNWLNTSQRFHMEERAAELDAITAEATRLFHKQIMSQFFIELYAHGNIHKDDALTLTDLVETTLRPRVLPRAQMPAWRSLIIPPGSNLVYEKTLKDAGNVNHAIEYVLYTGANSDRKAGAMTLLLEQMVHEPAFDQLRTKEQLGYVVFTGSRDFDTRTGFRFLIQSERPPQYLESRIDAFIDQYTQVLENMSGDDFEGHKRSVISRRLEKLKNLDQESHRHWAHIWTGTYNFELAFQDAENVKNITKDEVVEVWHRLIHPASEKRAKLSVRLFALGALSSDENISELVKDLEMDEATGLKLKAVLLQSEKRHDLPSLKDFLVHEMHLTADKVAKVLDLAEKSQEKQDVDGIKGEAGEALAEVVPAVVTYESETQQGEEKPLPEEELRPAPPCAVKPVYITDVWSFKSGLAASEAQRPVKDLSEFEETAPKL